MSPDVEVQLAGHLSAEWQCPFDAVHLQVFPTGMVFSLIDSKHSMHIVI